MYLLNSNRNIQKVHAIGVSSLTRILYRVICTNFQHVGAQFRDVNHKIISRDKDLVYLNSNEESPITMTILIIT